jgi:hypothetical protein
MGAALDLASRRVEATCTGCLRRLENMVGPGDVLGELRQLVEADGTVPGDWRAAARVAFGWLALDVPVAELVYDSTTVQLAVRRQARFVTATGGVELELEMKDDEVALRGELVAAGPAKVTVRWPGGELTSATDEAGTFRFHDLPRAPLHVQVHADSPCKTGWLLP